MTNARPIRQVICCKWGTKFPASDVDRLYRMVRKWVSGDLHFYCVTDHPEGIDPNVRILPLPEVPVVGHRNDRGWKKLGLFAPDLGGPSGDVVYLDLDVVIVEPIDPLFEDPRPYVICKDYKALRYRHAFTGNSSVLKYRGGTLTEIHDELRALGDRVFTAYRNEQEILSDHMRRRGVLEYWPREWCVSYKHDCVHLAPLGWFKPPRIPAGAKILVFHGNPKPEDAVRGGHSKWYRHVKPAPWLADYLEV